MKKIFFTLIILLLTLVGMAYLYFSRLNKENSYNEISLYAAAANSGLIFSVQNDKSIFEILKGQDLFEHLLGQQKFNQLSGLKDRIISSPALNPLMAGENIFISFSAGKDKNIDFLISTQLNNEEDKLQLLQALQSGGFKTSDTAGIKVLHLNDSTYFYLGLDKNLILLSGSAEPVKLALNFRHTPASLDFISYIRSNSKLSKNSVGNLYIDYNRIPALLKAILPGSLNGNLSLLKQQNAYAAMSYNFSKERLFFNGNSKLNSSGNYLSLFAALNPQKNSIDNLLPKETANFSLYAIPDYKKWRLTLNAWFALRKEDSAVKKIIENTDLEYHLKVNGIFPEYFKNQLISFQLSSSEELGAISLSNGDKVKQLLIDISEDYNQDIKRFKVSGLLYCYFGEPFKKFNKPFYTIIDNNMVFSNQPGALQQFLEKYRSNQLLINEREYINLFSQISNAANITFYVNPRNAADLVRNAIYTPYYRHFRSDKGLGKFNAVIYQLSGDKGNFQTNLLVNTKAEISVQTADSTLTITQP